MDKPNPLTCSLASLHHHWHAPHNYGCNCARPEAAQHKSWCNITPIYAAIWKATPYFENYAGQMVVNP